LAELLPRMKASQVAILFTLLAVLASLALPGIPRSFAAPDELLINGGFEEGAEPWQAYSGTLDRTGDPDFVRSGSSAVEFTADKEAGWFYQVVQVQPGGNYTFSGWAIKNDSNISDICLWISFMSGNALLASHGSPSLTGTSADYPTEPLSVSAKAPPGADSARVGAVLYLVATPTGPATAYFDDMSFTGPPPSTPTPTPSPSLTPTPSPSPSPTPTPSPSPSPTTTPTPSPTPAGTTANEGDIMINEVQYDPPQGGPDASFEWVELFNRTTEPIDLRGWRIRDNGESDSIPPLLLPANGFAVIAATEEGFYENFPDFDGSIIFLHGSMGNGLSNDGDSIILEDSEGRVIDAISYGDDDTMMSPPCPSVDVGHSLERSPPGGGFSDNPHPTPGYSLSPIPTPAPTETPVETQTPTIPPTETPTASPPGGATTESSGGSGLSGIALRGVGIALAIVIFGILFWVTRRKGSQK